VRFQKLTGRTERRWGAVKHLIVMLPMVLLYRIIGETNMTNMSGKKRKKIGSLKHYIFGEGFLTVPSVEFLKVIISVFI